MRISKLTIKNFKGFKDKTFDFPSMFTVVIGDNATGKTSLLDALAIAAGSFLLGIDGADSKHIGREQIRTIWKGTDPKPQLPVKIQTEGVFDAEQRLSWSRTLEKYSGRTTYKDASDIAHYASLLLASSRKGESSPVFPVITYHGTGRLWAEHQEKIDYKKQDEGVLMGYKDCLSPKSSSKAFLSWYKTYFSDAKNSGDEAAGKLIKTFNETLTQLIPEWQEISFHYGLDELVGTYYSQGAEPEKMYFSQLSDGYRNMIGMAADIAYRCIKLNGHLGLKAISETPGIVLIDEFDLHLHPNWQKVVVERFKKTFPKVQFVCTTHSPFIVQSLKAEELINLDQLKVSSDPFRKSLEEVAEDDMGVEDVSRSQRYREMEEIARQFFDKVAEGRHSQNDSELQELKNKLKDFIGEFGSDPAFSAILKSEI